MKTKNLIRGILILLLGFSACQNKTSETEGDNTSMDMNGNSNMGMNGDSSMSTGMMGARDKMMNGMHRMGMTGNVDMDFAMMMKAHHQGAIDMAQEDLNSGKDETLKQMAQKTVDAQKSEISELETFLNSHKDAAKNYDPDKKDIGFAKGMAMGMNMLMDQPNMDASASADQQFVSMMIPHHQSAVSIAEGFLQHGKNARLLAMAKKMIADQNKDIEEFKKWNENHHE